MLTHWIWFAHRPGLTDRVRAVLMEHFCDPEDIFYADEAALRDIPELSREALEGLLDKNLTASEEILEVCGRKQLHILTYRDAAYPARLKNIPDPPMVLYYKGQLPEFDAYPTIGIVGTRKASAYGLTAAKRLGYQIGKCGGIVVSGLAYGIDGTAMSGTLTAGGKTVGVLGCGADIVYPPSNQGLFRDVERYGCIISEFAPGTPPAQWTFPKRNRIISGLSNGVLVVEAPERSGALITARLAAEQGRDVFVVPGNIDVPTCARSNSLLRDGAILVSSGWEVLCEYQAMFPDKLRREDTPLRMTASPEEVRGAAEEAPLQVAQNPARPGEKSNFKKKLEKKSIDNPAPTAYSDLDARLSGLSGDERAVAACLADGERLVDDVIAETGLTTGRLLGILTMLELKGVVKRLPGKRVTLQSRE